MKACTCALSALTCFSAAVIAAPPTETHSTTFQTEQGELIVNWGQPTPRDYGPPPPFSQLDRRGVGYITSEEAEAYPPLANDFLYANGNNRNGRLTRAQYERWAQHR